VSRAPTINRSGSLWFHGSEARTTARSQDRQP
jgi:hypothetical protein